MLSILGPKVDNMYAKYIGYNNSTISNIASEILSYTYEDMPELLGFELTNTNTNLEILNKARWPKIKMLTLNKMWNDGPTSHDIKCLNTFFKNLPNNELECLDISNNSFGDKPIDMVFTQGLKIRVLLMKNCTGINKDTFRKILDKIDSKYIECIAVDPRLLEGVENRVQNVEVLDVRSENSFNCVDILEFPKLHSFNVHEEKQIANMVWEKIKYLIINDTLYIKHNQPHISPTLREIFRRIFIVRKVSGHYYMELSTRSKYGT